MRGPAVASGCYGLGRDGTNADGLRLCRRDGFAVLSGVAISFLLSRIGLVRAGLER